MLIKWTKDLEIGVELIDNEHKSIIEEFEKLYALMRVGGGHDFYPLVIDFLEDYIQTHLDHEETLQMEINYPSVEEHVELHKYFKEKVTTLKKAHEDNKISNKDLIELNKLIQDWFVDHILKEDVKIATFLNETK